MLRLRTVLPVSVHKVTDEPVMVDEVRVDLSTVEPLVTFDEVKVDGLIVDPSIVQSVNVEAETSEFEH